jgi:hypothetical protein
MPVAYLDLPSGLGVDVKKRLVKEVAECIHHAYMIPDTRVLLREWPAEQTSVDGELSWDSSVNTRSTRLPSMT